MAFEKDKNNRSFYQPNAFSIRLRPEYVDSNGNISEKGYPVFIHEYGHLLQDTTTCYGIIDFVHFTDIIQDFIQLVKCGKNNGTIKIPLIRHYKSKTMWIKSLLEYKKCYNPNEDWRKGAIWAFNGFETKDYIRVPYKDKEGKVPIISARFVDNETGEEIVQKLGVREIKECYSMALENIQRGEDFPYSKEMEFQYAAIERILDREFERVDNFQMITVCHWALQSTHPIEEFFDIFMEFKAKEEGLPD